MNTFLHESWFAYHLPFTCTHGINQICMYCIVNDRQVWELPWQSGKVLDLRSEGLGFKSRHRHFFLVDIFLINVSRTSTKLGLSQSTMNYVQVSAIIGCLWHRFILLQLPLKLPLSLTITAPSKCYQINWCNLNDSILMTPYKHLCMPNQYVKGSHTNHLSIQLHSSDEKRHRHGP